MILSINGQKRSLPELDANAVVARLVDLLEMKPDRVAVERNGDIVPRSKWETTELREEDKLEIVQFVGGGWDTDGPQKPGAYDHKFIACRLSWSV